MKVSVSSYSYAQAVRDGRMNLYDIIPKAAQMGFDGVDFSGLDLPKGQTLDQAIEKVTSQSRELGLPIVNYAVGSNLLALDQEAEIERVKREVDVAARLGVPVMRHDAAFAYPSGHVGPTGFDDALPVIARGCRAITEYAAQKGVRTTIENHGYFVQDGARVVRLVNAVNHPNFGLLVDVGNFMCADDAPAEAVGLAARYAYHVHVKDFHWKSGAQDSPGAGWFSTRAGNHLRGAIVGHGDVPVKQCLRLLKAAGYDGYLTIEFEGMEDCILALELGLAALRKMLATL